MLRKLLGACVGLAMMGMAGTASAALMYDESIGGDLSASDTLTFMIGSNVVSGDAFFFISPISKDEDSFDFVIPFGGELLSVALSVFNFQSFEDSSGEVTRFRIALSGGGGGNTRRGYAGRVRPKPCPPADRSRRRRCGLPARRPALGGGAGS